jgi:hypothetical protein
MPRSWICTPCDDSSIFFTPTCLLCGQPGKFYGWWLGRYERMAQYQYIYGLKVDGPHSSMARRLLFPMRKPCPDCGGRGLSWSEARASDTRPCTSCEGTGEFLACSQEEFDALRRQVLDAYPEAELKNPTRNFLGGSVMYNGVTGIAFNACDKREPPEPAE